MPGLFRYPFPYDTLTNVDSKVRTSMIMDRDRALEDYLSAPGDEFPFSLPDVLFLTESPPTVLRFGGLVTEVVCLLKVAGSTTSTIELLKNGSTVATVNLTSGLVRASVQGVATRFIADTDVMSVEVTAAGTSAEGLTVLVRY